MSQQRLRWGFVPASKDALVRLLRDPTGFHGFGSVLVCTPEGSVRTLWSWFATVAEETVASVQYRGKYRHDDGALIERFESRHHAEDLPGPAFASAIASWTRESPDSFLDFAGAVLSTDLEVLHLFLAEGFKAIAAQRPTAVLDYLLGDKRRFRLGNLEDESGVTKALIEALSPSLAPGDLQRLIDGILRATSGLELSFYERKERLQVLKWIRLEHLELLMAIPEGCRTQHLVQRIREELRAVGEPVKRRRAVVNYSSDVQMTATGMAKAKDRDVLHFLGFHPDKSGWGSSLNRRRERSVDASRVFGEFAQEHPERARRLIGRILPGHLERPVGHAISAMSERGTLPPDDIVDLVTSLHERGYSSIEFRHAAAFALVRMAKTLEGLDDRVCRMLMSWLTDWLPMEKVPSWEVKADRTVATNLHPLLWSYGGHRIVPGGNYPVLRALESGLMLRKPPAANSWLSILEEHLDRAENPDVWEVLADDLRFLWHADRKRTITFFDRLFDAQPALAQGVAGLRLIAWIHQWLPNEIVHHRLREWNDGSWDCGRQAAGEFAGLRALLVPEDEVASGLIEKEMAATAKDGDASDFLYGLACTMAGVWAEGVLREPATGWIERLASICNRKIACAIRPVFHAAQGKPWDSATERVLRACADRPALLAADTHFLPQLLKEVLRDGMDPVLVGRMAIGMIREADVEKPSNTWVSSASDLFEISTALQRIDDVRIIGIELFEELLGVEVYGVSDELGRFDRNRFA